MFSVCVLRQRVCLKLYMHACAHAISLSRASAHTHKSVCTCVHVQVYTCLCVCMCVRVHACLRVCAFICKLTYTRTRKRIQTENLETLQNKKGKKRDEFVSQWAELKFLDVPVLGTGSSSARAATGGSKAKAATGGRKAKGEAGSSRAKGAAGGGVTKATMPMDFQALVEQNDNLRHQLQEAKAEAEANNNLLQEAKAECDSLRCELQCVKRVREESAPLAQTEEVKKPRSQN